MDLQVNARTRRVSGNLIIKGEIASLWVTMAFFHLYFSDSRGVKDFYTISYPSKINSYILCNQRF